jgi:hypothetical protein
LDDVDEFALQTHFRCIRGSSGEPKEHSDEYVGLVFFVKFLSFPLQIQSQIFLTWKYFDDKENVFTLSTRLHKMRLSDRQVVLLVFPDHFQPNISLVLRMPSQVDT